MLFVFSIICIAMVFAIIVYAFVDGRNDYEEGN